MSQHSGALGICPCGEDQLRCDDCREPYCLQCDDGSSSDRCPDCEQVFRSTCHAMLPATWGYYGGSPPEECGNGLPCQRHGGRGRFDDDYDGPDTLEEARGER